MNGKKYTIEGFLDNDGNETPFEFTFTYGGDGTFFYDDIGIPLLLNYKKYLWLLLLIPIIGFLIYKRLKRRYVILSTERVEIKAIISKGHDLEEDLLPVKEYRKEIKNFKGYKYFYQLKRSSEGIYHYQFEKEVVN